MNPITLDTPGHESGVNEVKHLFIDEALTFRFDPKPFQSAAIALEKFSNVVKSIPQSTRSKHAKARQLRFRARNS